MEAHNHKRSKAESDSDSSDEEEMNRLREAVVFTFQPSEYGLEGMKKTCVDVKLFTESNKQPSKRYIDNIDDYETNELKTTPEFRAHVSKKLSEMLDRMLDYTATPEQTINSTKSEKMPEGIKLFAGSSKLCTESTVNQLLAPSPCPKFRRPVSSSSSDSSEYERLASAAVTEDWLIKEREVYSRLQQSIPSSNQAVTASVPEGDVSCSIRDTVSLLLSAKWQTKKKRHPEEKEDSGNVDGASSCSARDPSHEQLKLFNSDTSLLKSSCLKKKNKKKVKKNQDHNGNSGSVYVNSTACAQSSKKLKHENGSVQTDSTVIQKGNNSSQLPCRQWWDSSEWQIPRVGGKFKHKSKSSHHPA